MAPSSLQHRRTHNLLLVSKLLSYRDAASPFTLVLDSLEQSGKPLLAECMNRAAISKIQVIFVAFETLRNSRNADVFIEAWRQDLQSWQREVHAHLKGQTGQRKLLVFDSLNALAAAHSSDLPGLLSSFAGPTTTLLASYHLDVPNGSSSHAGNSAYSPSPLTLLRYLATTMFTTHSLHHILAAKAARDRSHAEPVHGLEQGIEGVLQGLGANDPAGVVLEMEHRRKSGRGVREWYFLPRQPLTQDISKASTRPRETVLLLEDHPQYRSPDEAMAAANEVQNDTTFELGLTEKQKRDREGVVLPYFDAQQGGGDGGRILYDMGEEDDFDEEEDEI